MDLSEVIKKADELNDDKKHREAYELLKPYVDTAEDPELLWRLIRVYNRVGMHAAKDEQEKKDLAKKVQEISERTMKAHDDNFHVLHESSLMLMWVSKFDSPKVMIEKLHISKKYIEKAIAINGNDAGAKHFLGRWCFIMATIPWIQKTLAKTFVAELPSCTVEEGLKYLQEAEELSPNFYKGNLLYLAKAHHKLGHKEEAKKWVEKVFECEVVELDDDEILEDAKQLKRKLSSWF